MVKVKPFAALRPPKKIVREVASHPYDVLNSFEAKKEAGEKSLLHIIKPEIDFDPIIDEKDPRAYEKAVLNFKEWQENGWLVRDPKEMYYIYAQTMGSHTQYGIVLCANVEDYLSGKIKKHELTRRDKEEDRRKHVRMQKANVEPVFFAYEENRELDEIVKEKIKKQPEYDFTSEDGFGHKLWVIDDDRTIAEITGLFAKVPAFYVADGHHRTAAAAGVAQERKEANPHHTGNEEYNYFMAVAFPENQLHIMDYNRVVRDLNGMGTEEFLNAVGKDFVVEKKGTATWHPSGLHNLSMYLDGNWYSLTAKAGTYDNSDPIGVLDVTVLSNSILNKLLGIKDLRTDKRIDFVGGIRGLEELKRRVDDGEMKVAFALYPVSMKQLINIADSGKIMPPKTTWFEPKLRSGLFIHTF
ncbi:MAG: DUF1015 family protein [Bacteroidales bacterium]|jgi:uncharacterized protein (DUF1015 family)|nr:DUF1015 family protein [Bacteroidales bacterium]MCI2122012.1 DUF1015 family protein [Bacteroidales bacterium]MCI2145184.1 DUF1015 family protein [Bacteroidales bacterium]